MRLLNNLPKQAFRQCFKLTTPQYLSITQHLSSKVTQLNIIRQVKTMIFQKPYNVCFDSDTNESVVRVCEVVIEEGTDVGGSG